MTRFIKLIKQVRNELSTEKLNVEKDKIKKMILLIERYEVCLKSVKAKISDLKEQLKKGDYKAIENKIVYLNHSGLGNIKIIRR